MFKQARAHARGTTLSYFLLLGVVGASACVGSIGGTSDGTPAGAAGGGAQTGASGQPGASATSGTSSSSATSGSGATSGSTPAAPVPTLAVSNADVLLADPDPTTAGCAVSGETLVPFRALTRLNRVEYDNTARDLLGDTAHVPLSMLPADGGDGGFDNNAAALLIDPTLAQTYQQLAETLAANAMAADSPGRAVVLVCTTTDAACVTQIASTFAALAWRRPATTAEVTNLVALYNATTAAGFSSDNAAQVLVEGALLSPNFLFRPEIDATPDTAAQHPVSPYELATRLSYYLWSSMPDAALEAAAASGQLGTRAGILQQEQRMWADPKASAFASRFPGEWLNTLNITAANQPDPTIFPKFTAAVQADMQAETAAFMADLVTGNENFLDFIDAKFTYLNQDLATFYGIPGTFGTQLTRVDLTGNTQRGGILTQGSFLTVTSVPNRTSPVDRGQWVLARMMASPPPAPPANVPQVSAPVPSDGETFRQIMEMHVNTPQCAVCHNAMDPIGFGLENYDGVGEWRTTDNGLPVDAASALVPSGQSFSGALQLESILKADPRVPSAVVQFLLSYALGRDASTASGDWANDQCFVGALTTAFQTTDNGRMTALASRVAGTDDMRLRRETP